MITAAKVRGSPFAKGAADPAVEIAQAVIELVMEKLPGWVEDCVGGRLKSLEQFPQKLDKSLSARLDGEVSPRLKGLEEAVPGLVLRHLKKEIDREVARVTAAYEAKLLEAGEDHRREMQESQKGYLEAAKELRDAVRGDRDVAALVGKVLMKELQGEVSGLAGHYEGLVAETKALQAQRLEEFTAAQEKRLAGFGAEQWKAMSDSHAAAEAKTAETVESLNKSLTDLRSEFTAAVAQVKNLHQTQLDSGREQLGSKMLEFAAASEKRLGEMKNAYEAGLAKFHSVLDGFQALHLELPAGGIQVHVPQQQPPSVSVSAPPATVNVEVPRRLVRKVFTYEEHTGRPLEIIEEEIEAKE